MLLEEGELNMIVVYYIYIYICNCIHIYSLSFLYFMCAYQLRRSADLYIHTYGKRDLDLPSGSIYPTPPTLFSQMHNMFETCPCPVQKSQVRSCFPYEGLNLKMSRVT